MSDNKNLPAFAALNESEAFIGLTKREYFAGLAMQGLLMNEGEIGLKTILEALGLPDNTEYKYPEHWMQYNAMCAVAASDALLTELSKPSKP